MQIRGTLKLPIPLRMPLRDMARGMAGLASFGEQAVRNAPQILPLPLEKLLRSAIKDVEAAATRNLNPDITQAEVLSASHFVVGDGTDAHAFVHVLASGWEQLRSSRKNTIELFSETIATTRMTIDGGGGRLGAGPLHASGLLDLLRKSAAIGRPPGLPNQRASAEQAEVDINLFAVMLWLLAARPETLAAEQSLLELSAILTGVHKAAIIGAMGDRQALAIQLASLSEQL